MDSLRIAIAALLLTASSLAIGPVRAADKPKVDPRADPKAAEVEKLLLDVPKDVTQGEWIKAWREKLIVSYSEEMSIDFRGQLTNGDIVKFAVENKTPCTIKVTGGLPQMNSHDPLAGLTVDGRAPKKLLAKEKPAEPKSETWTIESGKKLSIFKKPTSAKRVMDVPLKNDFDKKALISVLYTGAFCTIEVVPNDKDAKPLELVLIKRVGANGLKVAVSGYFLCRPADVKDIMDRMSKFN